MKLRYKKTGEIIETVIVNHGDEWEIRNAYTDEVIQTYNSLAKLYEEWEDVPEESKTFFTIYYDGTISEFRDGDDEQIRDMKAIGNHFETREEAELAVRKLKAWKRLKDDGLKIREYELNGGTDRNGCFTGDICLTLDISKPVYEDILQLLFGGEE